LFTFDTLASAHIETINTNKAIAGITKTSHMPENIQYVQGTGIVYITSILFSSIKRAGYTRFKNPQILSGEGNARSHLSAF